MRAVRAIGNVSMGIVVLLAVAFAALSLLSRGAPSDTRTWIGGFKPFVVLSGSMEPSIHVGSVLLVRRVDPATVGAGDIVTYVTPEGRTDLSAPSVTTHRVVTVVKDGQEGGLAFSTQGDANEDLDASQVPAANVLGTAVFSVPYLGYFSKFASTRVGLLTLIVGPALLLIVTEVVSMVRGRSRTRSADTAREGS